MKEKRAVLDGVAAELRRIIGAPVANALEHRKGPRLPPDCLARPTNSEHIIAFAGLLFPCA